MIRPSTVTGPSYRARLGIAVDPVSAGVGVATAAVGLWMNNVRLSNDAKTATTLIVNGLEEQLKNLDSAYFAEPNRTCADQRAALNAYDQAWLWLQSPQACGNPNYGAPGNRCITDRAPGGMYPWAKYYRDPIANDAALVGAGCDTGGDVILPTVGGGYQETGITSTGGSATTGTTSGATAAVGASAGIVAGVDNTTLILVAALLAGGLVLATGGGK